MLQDFADRFGIAYQGWFDSGGQGISEYQLL
jgi:hypothetical protein